MRYVRRCEEFARRCLEGEPNRKFTMRMCAVIVRCDEAVADIDRGCIPIRKRALPSDEGCERNQQGLRENARTPRRKHEGCTAPVRRAQDLESRGHFGSRGPARPHA